MFMDNADSTVATDLPVPKMKIKDLAHPLTTNLTCSKWPRNPDHKTHDIYTGNEKNPNDFKYRLWKDIKD